MCPSILINEKKKDTHAPSPSPPTCVNRAHLASIDTLAVRHLEEVEKYGLALEASPDAPSQPDLFEDLTFTTHLSDNSVVNLNNNSGAAGSTEGENIKVTVENWRHYVKRVEEVRIRESSLMLRAFQDGLSSVLPMEISPLFTDQEIERLICGVREVDVELLKQCTE